MTDDEIMAEISKYLGDPAEDLFYALPVEARHRLKELVMEWWDCTIG